MHAGENDGISDKMQRYFSMLRLYSPHRDRYPFVRQFPY
jgi:hypothetical protein